MLIQLQATYKVREILACMYSKLHWLDIPQRVQYKLGVTLHRCLQNKAPQYLMDYCTRTSDVSSHQRLRSANRHQLMVPQHLCSTFGCQAVSIAGRWNGTFFQTDSRTLLGVLKASNWHWKLISFCSEKRRLAHEALRDALHKSTTTTTATACTDMSQYACSLGSK